MDNGGNHDEPAPTAQPQQHSGNQPPGIQQVAHLDSSGIFSPGYFFPPEVRRDTFHAHAPRLGRFLASSVLALVTITGLVFCLYCAFIILHHVGR